MFNGKQVENDVRTEILYGYMESLTYEREFGRQFKVWTDSEDGENRYLYLSYGYGDKTYEAKIAWECAFLDGVIAETVDKLYEEANWKFMEETLPYLGW